MTAPTRIEPPSTVYAEYWPANVLLPGGEIRRRVRAYLTDAGLIMYYTKPTDDLVPHFIAPIDFEATPPPDIHAHNVGVDVYLARPEPTDGGEPLPLDLVIITPSGGCGCGASLRFWKPSWTGHVSPWPGA